MIKNTLTALFHSTERISYRRLSVFVAATGLLLVDKLTGDLWVYVAVAYIAGQAAPAMAKALKG
jgi:hypothetical protein